MSTTSKSPRKVALVALEVGKEALPDYSHRFSPKVFTQAQLFACLVLKQFFRTDYRGIMGILADTPNLCQTIGLKKISPWTTLQKASRRLLRNTPVQKLLDATVARAWPRRQRKRRPGVRRAAPQLLRRLAQLVIGELAWPGVRELLREAVAQALHDREH